MGMEGPQSFGDKIKKLAKVAVVGATFVGGPAEAKNIETKPPHVAQNIDHKDAARTEPSHQQKTDQKHEDTKKSKGEWREFGW